MRELAMLVGNHADRQRHDRHPEYVATPIAPEKVPGPTIVFRVLVWDQLVEDLDDLFTAHPHLIQCDREYEVISADMTNEALIRVALHQVPQNPREQFDHPVAFVVAVSIVEFLEVIQVGVTDRKQLVRVNTLGDVTLDLGSAGQPRGWVNADITVGLVQRYHDA